jgi:serine/threonine protein kinase
MCVWVCVDCSDAGVVVRGQGSFGQVVSAIDTSTGGKVAVKVIKNREAFR